MKKKKQVASSCNTNTERKRISKKARQICNAIDSALTNTDSLLCALSSNAEKDKLSLALLINMSSIAEAGVLAKKLGDNHISDLLFFAMHKLRMDRDSVLQVMDLLKTAKNDITAEYLNE